MVHLSMLGSGIDDARGRTAAAEGTAGKETGGEMADQASDREGRKVLEDLRKIVLQDVLFTEALINVLERKGIVEKDEIMEEMRSLRQSMIEKKESSGNRH
jgi:hypothetical protein